MAAQSARQLVTLPDDRELSYTLSTQPSDGPIVLLSNSLCADSSSWDRVVAVLESHGFRTLRYDQPGHGSSSVPADLASTSFDSLAEDVYALLQHLGLGSVHAWVGVSMGAATGIYFVTKHPGLVRRLAVCDTISSSPANAGTADAFGPRVEAARRSGSMDATVQQTLERWFGQPWLDSHPDEASRMRQLMMRTSIDGFDTCCAALRSRSFDLRPLLGKVGAAVDQVVLVVGEKDANLPTAMADMRAAIDKSMQESGKETPVELKVIPGAGHVCYIDGFDAFTDTILAFLQKQ